MRKHSHNLLFPIFLITHAQPQLVNSVLQKMGREDIMETAVLGSWEFNYWNFIRKLSEEPDFTRGSVSTYDLGGALAPVTGSRTGRDVSHHTPQAAPAFNPAYLGGGGKGAKVDDSSTAAGWRKADWLRGRWALEPPRHTGSPRGCLLCIKDQSKVGWLKVCWVSILFTIETTAVLQRMD